MKTLQVILTTLFLAGAVNAGTVSLPNLIAGPIEGNDNAEIVSSIVGQSVELVGKFDDVTESLGWYTTGIADALTLDIIDQGLAFFFSSGVVKGTFDGENWDYLAVKSGTNFFLFDRTGPLTAFETDCHFLSHVSLYRAVPEAASIGLVAMGLVCGLVTYGSTRRRRYD